MVGQRAAAVAHSGGELLGEVGRLRPVHRAVTGLDDEAAEQEQPDVGGRHQHEVGDCEEGEHGHAGQKQLAAADVVREQAEAQDHRDIGQAQSRVGVEDRGAVVTQLGRRVGDQPDRCDIERSVGGYERSGGERDLFRIGLESVEHGHLSGRLRVECLLKDRALGHGEPDPHADGDEQRAGQERDPPSPLEELLVGERCCSSA